MIMKRMFYWFIFAFVFLEAYCQEPLLRLKLVLSQVSIKPGEAIYWHGDIENTGVKNITLWTNFHEHITYGKEGEELKEPNFYQLTVPPDCRDKILWPSILAPPPKKYILEPGKSMAIPGQLTAFLRQGYELPFFLEQGNYLVCSYIDIFFLDKTQEEMVKQGKKHFYCDIEPVKISSDIVKIKVQFEDKTQEKTWKEILTGRSLLSFLSPYDNIAMDCYEAEGIKKRANDAKEFLKKYGDTIYGDRIRMGLGAVLLERKEVFDPIEGEKFLNEVKCKSPEWKDVTRNAYKKAVENCKDSSQKEHFQKLAQQTRSEKDNLEKAGKVEEYTKCQ
jgi:hypothetical protein